MKKKSKRYKLKMERKRQIKWKTKLKESEKMIEFGKRGGRDNNITFRIGRLDLNVKQKMNERKNCTQNEKNGLTIN